MQGTIGRTPCRVRGERSEVQCAVKCSGMTCRTSLTAIGSVVVPLTHVVVVVVQKRNRRRTGLEYLKAQWRRLIETGGPGPAQLKRYELWKNRCEVLLEDNLFISSDEEQQLSSSDESSSVLPLLRLRKKWRSAGADRLMQRMDDAADIATGGKQAPRRTITSTVRSGSVPRHLQSLYENRSYMFAFDPTETESAIQQMETPDDHHGDLKLKVRYQHHQPFNQYKRDAAAAAAVDDDLNTTWDSDLDDIDGVIDPFDDFAAFGGAAPAAAAPAIDTPSPMREDGEEAVSVRCDAMRCAVCE